MGVARRQFGHNMAGYGRAAKRHLGPTFLDWELAAKPFAASPARG